MRTKQPKPVKIPRREKWQDAFDLMVKALNAPDPTPEYEFALFEGRKWRFDFAWKPLMLAVEIEGGVWSNGAHVRGAHYQSDMEKYNHAQIAGWIVLRFTPEQIKRGEAFDTIERALKVRGL